MSSTAIRQFLDALSSQEARAQKLLADSLRRQGPALEGRTRRQPEDVGHRRRDVFERALRSRGISADKAIFVDDIPQYVLAAEIVGFKGLWLVRTTRRDVSPAFQQIQQISSLWEIVPIALGWESTPLTQPA